MDVKFKISEIVNWLTMYKEVTNCKGVCVGLSGGKDSTVEAATTKLMYLLGKDLPAEEIRHRMSISFTGEISM